VRLWSRILTALAVLLVLSVIGMVGAWEALRAHYTPQLPSVESLREVNPGAPLRILSADHKLIGEFGAERRIPLRFEQIPKPLVSAFLAAEDDRFFSHPGVDWQGLVRATLVFASTGEKRQGGSTITMQLARGVFLSRERSFDRKFKEIFLALKIEHELSKQQILELYLNRIFLGARAYGVGAAAQVYFGKPISQLSIAQMATLAGLPKAPSRDNPLVNTERARERRDYVLRRMHELGELNAEQFKVALAETLTAQEHGSPVELEAGYVAEMVRNDLLARYGDSAYTVGYEVTTTIDSTRQRAAEQAVRNGIYTYQERHGYDGAEGHVDADTQAALRSPEHNPALTAFLEAQPHIGDLIAAVVVQSGTDQLSAVTATEGLITLPRAAFAWANLAGKHQLKTGDLIHLRHAGDGWRLAHAPEVQAALVAVDPRDGAIQALVGGYDYTLNQFNRITQARRQVGSGFKPYLYTAALAKGYSPASIFLDAPIVFENADFEDEWRPENYSRSFNGPMRLREALAQSRNLVSIRLLQAVGLPYLLDFVPSRFGLPKEQLPENLTTALGTASLTPYEMVRGYSVIANGGFFVEPYFIQSIHKAGSEVFHAAPKVACPSCTDPDSLAIDSAGVSHPQAPRMLDAGVDYLINSMLRDVVTRGTAAQARELGRNDLAGKTGTTNDETDAWFNGFQPTLVSICWTGFDQPRPLGRGEVGGKASLPTWIEFMRTALKGVPQQILPRPNSIVELPINPATGKRVDPGFPGAISEIFLTDHPPPPDDGRIPGQEGGTLTDEIY